MTTGADLEVRVLGPDYDPLAAGDLRRLFPGSSLTQERLDRLRAWPRMLVFEGPQVVGAATCQRVGSELRVPEVGIGAPGAFRERDVLNTLLDALETACVAGGCRRLVINPPKMSLMFLERRGYVRMQASCAGGWLEKHVL